MLSKNLTHDPEATQEDTVAKLEEQIASYTTKIQVVLDKPWKLDSIKIDSSNLFAKVWNPTISTIDINLPNRRILWEPILNLLHMNSELILVQNELLKLQEQLIRINLDDTHFPLVKQAFKVKLEILKTIETNKFSTVFEWIDIIPSPRLFALISVPATVTNFYQQWKLKKEMRVFIQLLQDNPELQSEIEKFTPTQMTALIELIESVIEFSLFFSLPSAWLSVSLSSVKVWMTIHNRKKVKNLDSTLDRLLDSLTN